MDYTDLGNIRRLHPWSLQKFSGWNSNYLPLSRTLTPAHSKAAGPPGTNCRCTYEHGRQLARSRQH